MDLQHNGIDCERISLETLNKVIQSCGQYLTSSGYHTLLNILQSLTVDGLHHAENIKCAFQTLQLICTDFLSILSLDTLKLCIHCVGTFATQSDDLNISFTSIGLLWTLGDSVRLILERGQGVKVNGADVAAESSTSDPFAAKLMSAGASADDLLLAILLQLSLLCVDDRSEVRNSANQTLFRAIHMTYGPLWATDQWDKVLVEIVMPTILAVREASKNFYNSSRLILSVSTARSTTKQQLLDSLRDAETLKTPTATASTLATIKQWNETLVILLYGLSQIIGDYISCLRNSELFCSTIWPQILAFFSDEFCGVERVGGGVGKAGVKESAASHHPASAQCVIRRTSVKTSVAAIKAFKAIIDSIQSIPQSSPLWEYVWDSWVEIGGWIACRMSLVTQLHRFSPSVSLVDFLFKEESLLVYVNLFHLVSPRLHAFSTAPLSDSAPPIVTEADTSKIQRLHDIAHIILSFHASDDHLMVEGEWLVEVSKEIPVHDQILISKETCCMTPVQMSVLEIIYTRSFLTYLREKHALSSLFLPLWSPPPSMPHHLFPVHPVILRQTQKVLLPAFFLIG